MRKLLLISQMDNLFINKPFVISQTASYMLPQLFVQQSIKLSEHIGELQHPYFFKKIKNCLQSLFGIFNPKREDSILIQCLQMFTKITLHFHQYLIQKLMYFCFYINFKIKGNLNFLHNNFLYFSKLCGIIYGLYNLKQE